MIIIIYKVIINNDILETHGFISEGL